MGTHPFAAVAVPVPLRQTFHYAVPAEMDATAVVGARVRVRFGRRTVVGYVVARDQKAPAGVKARPIDAVLDTALPTFDAEQLGFLQWMADYYLAPLGEVLRGAHPSGINTRGVAAFELTPAGQFALDTGAMRIEDSRALAALTPGEPTLVSALPDTPPAAQVRRWTKEGWVIRTEVVTAPRVEVRTERTYRAVAPAPETPRGPGGRALRRDEIHRWLVGRGAVSSADVRAEFSALGNHLRTLVSEGSVVVEEREVIRDPFFGESVTRDIRPTLNAEQRTATTRMLASNGYAGFLLHGVTGSGKTEVYLHVIEAALAEGKGALVLVPEIALTPQLVRRFRARLGDEIAVLHSGLSDGARFDQWRRLRRGEVKVAIGARSAVFAPIAELRVIVVDEEHDGSFKQGDGVRYNARDMALVRGQRAGAVVILGSATPSLETTSNAQAGKLTRLALNERPTGGVLPRVEIVDQRAEIYPEDGACFLSQPVRAALAETIARGEQAIVFLNRRGFSSFMLCTSCGDVIECDRCAISMTYHKGRGHLRCHYCDATRAIPRRCPSCGVEALQPMGRGTERVEETLMTLFPKARIARLDRDTGGGRKLTETLRDVREGRVDILVGTQMVTKGHDFPNVTLVCALDADAGLNFPDFRAAERTFQLLTQVAGRAGRRTRPGRVLIQTYDPSQPCLEACRGHDYAQFATVELAERKAAAYPPYTHAAVIRVEGRDAGAVSRAAEGIASLLRQAGAGRDGTTLRGPAPAVLERLRGKTRWALLLTATARGPLRRLLAVIVEERENQPAEPRVIVDIDPYDLL